jgi:methionyl-tRNA synthetase
VHVVGKDILRHHAVYWPIMLKAMGIEMPKTLLAHGWWTIEGAKVSKSSGNIIDPVALIQKYGVDPFRYFMLHEVTVGFDGAYSEDLLRERYTHDLANDFGNLWFRLAAMVGKYFEGKIPQPPDAAKQDPLLQRAYGLWDEVCLAMTAYDPRRALDALWAVVSQANQYVEEKKPWSLAKNPANQPELAGVLWVLSEALAHIAYLLQPFVPATAGKMLERLHLKDQPVIRDGEAFRRPFVKVGTLIERGEALFPKLEDE